MTAFALVSGDQRVQIAKACQDFCTENKLRLLSITAISNRQEPSRTTTRMVFSLPARDYYTLGQFRIQDIESDNSHSGRAYLDVSSYLGHHQGRRDPIIPAHFVDHMVDDAMSDPIIRHPILDHRALRYVSALVKDIQAEPVAPEADNRVHILSVLSEILSRKILHDGRHLRSLIYRIDRHRQAIASGREYLTNVVRGLLTKVAMMDAIKERRSIEAGQFPRLTTPKAPLSFAAIPDALEDRTMLLNLLGELSDRAERICEQALEPSSRFNPSNEPYMGLRSEFHAQALNAHIRTILEESDLTTTFKPEQVRTAVFNSSSGALSGCLPAPVRKPQTTLAEFRL